MVINAQDRFAELPEEEQNAILERAVELYADEMTLAELRKARQRSQATLAKKLGIKQAALSRFERRADMYVSTLRDTIEAMGGNIKIIAQFPDHPPVSINLSDARKANTKTASPKPPRGRTSPSATRKLGVPRVKVPANPASKTRVAPKPGFSKNKTDS